MWISTPHHEITGKHSENANTTTYWKTKYNLNGVFTFGLPGGGQFTPLSPISYATASIMSLQYPRLVHAASKQQNTAASRELQVPWGSINVTEGVRLIHGLVKQTQLGVSFIAFWTQYEGFQTLKSCQFLNRSLFRLWAQFGGGHGDVSPHFFKRGDIICHVHPTFFSLGFVFGEVSKITVMFVTFCVKSCSC